MAAIILTMLAEIIGVVVIAIGLVTAFADYMRPVPTETKVPLYFVGAGVLLCLSPLLGVFF